MVLVLKFDSRPILAGPSDFAADIQIRSEAAITGLPDP